MENVNHAEYCLTWILTESTEAPISIRQAALKSLLKSMSGNKEVEELKLDPEVYNKLQELYCRGKKIEMIKVIRTFTGLALKEAKDFVEANWDFS